MLERIDEQVKTAMENEDLENVAVICTQIVEVDGIYNCIGFAKADGLRTGFECFYNPDKERVFGLILL